jgi:GNAT superfamily N-acetyltransferase
MPTVEPFEVNDPAALEDWIRVSEESVVDLPHALTWTAVDVRDMFTNPSAYVQLRGYVCRDDEGAFVGWALMDLPLSDNTSMASVVMGVPPRLRGRGYGDALVEAMRADAQEAGRTIVMSHPSWPMGTETSPARRFAEKHGLTLRNTILHQVLDLPLDDGLLDRVVQESAQHHRGYEILSWTGACPPEWVDEFCVLRASMNQEAPTGELELEPEVFDAARLEEEDERNAARQTYSFTAVAVAPDQTLAGFTQLGAPYERPKAEQWDTLVVRAHRGHRLGMALKVANLRALRDAALPATEVNTWNATTNAPMIAINQQLGFRVVKSTGEFQGPIPAG